MRSSKLVYGLAALLAIVSLTACANPKPKLEQDIANASAEAIAAGAEIASTRCGSCHNAGAAGESPLPQAPPLRALAQRYRLEVLREEFQQGVHVGVEQMPKFDLSIAEIDALSAYLASIQQPSAAPASVE